MYYYDDSGIIIMFIFMVVVFFGLLALVRSRRGGGSNSTPASSPAVQQNKAKIAEDIKATSTSRMVDAIAILDDLSSTSPGYRQYAELIGTTQASGGIVAPYSKRQVAYYDLRCFKVEHIGGRDVETLIAHEKSIEPFYFNDGTSPQNVYVDLDSFGNDIVLVNSANRIEGPNSDFAKALGQATGSGGSSASNAYAMVGEWLGAIGRSGRALGSYLFGPVPALAFAGAGIGSFEQPASRMQEASHILQARGMGRPPMGGNPFGGSMGGNPFGGPMGGNPFGGSNPFAGYGNLGSFLGGTGNMGKIGGPYGGYWGGNRSSSSGDIIAGLALGALLSTISSTSATTGGPSPYEPTSQFRGYRIVEDIVPLNYSVYCLGEIYRNGQNVTMARSTSKSYPSSFFATKLEAEVLSHLGN